MSLTRRCRAAVQTRVWRKRGKLRPSVDLSVFPQMSANQGRGACARCRGKAGPRADAAAAVDGRRRRELRDWRFARPATRSQSRPAFVIARASRGQDSRGCQCPIPAARPPGRVATALMHASSERLARTGRVEESSEARAGLAAIRQPGRGVQRRRVRGSPKRGSTLESMKLVMAVIWSPSRVSTSSPTACATGVCSSSR